MLKQLAVLALAAMTDALSLADYSIPVLPQPKTPLVDSEGDVVGLYVGFCEVEWPSTCSGSEYTAAIPYGNQTEDNSLQFEDGYKGVRGDLTEGRYLVFEANGYALSNPNNGEKQFEATAIASGYSSINQRWVLHSLEVESTRFNITGAVNGQYISQHSSLSNSVTGAEVYNITYIGGSQYIMQKGNGAFLNILSDGSLAFKSTPVPYNIWSVTYHS